MFRRFPSQLSKLCRWGLVWSLALASAHGVEQPSDEVLGHLGSEDFKERMTAQGALLEWARKQPEPAKDWLFRRAIDDANPEMRRRFTAVLKDLVSDEYLRDGEGYVGIRMMTVQVQVPDDKAQRFGISVSLVVPDSAAAKAGLMLGDVIVEAGDQKWNNPTADMLFTTWVRGHKPGQKITLKVLRNGKVLSLDLILGRRPPDSDMFMFGEPPDSATLAREAEAAKDAYFQNWFESRKAGR